MNELNRNRKWIGRKFFDDGHSDRRERKAKNKKRLFFDVKRFGIRFEKANYIETGRQQYTECLVSFLVACGCHFRDRKAASTTNNEKNWKRKTKTKKQNKKKINGEEED